MTLKRNLLALSATLLLIFNGCGSDTGADCPCTGDSCCCAGLDSECKQGYLCATDNSCKTVSQFAFTINVTGKIKSKPPTGSSWDTDGLPDPYVEVSRYGSQQCKSATADNTLEIKAECKLSTITVGTKLTLEVRDADGSKDTVIYKGGWPNGIPFSLFVASSPTSVPGSVDHTEGLSVSLKRQ